MSEVTPLAIDIAKLFAERQLKWKIGGSQKIPDELDVQAVLDRAKFELEYQAVNSHLKDSLPSLVMKHLHFKQTDTGSVEVYVKIGEIQ